MSAEPGREPHGGRWFKPLIIGPFVVLILGAGLVWIAATALLARHDADAVRSELPTLKSDLVHGNETGAAQLEAQMQQQAAAAHARTSGPAWWIAAKLPYVGAPAKTVRGATDIVDQLATQALPPALTAGQLLDPDKLRRGPNKIDTTRLAAAAAPLGRAAQASGTLIARAQALSGSTWLGKVNSDRTELLQDLTTLHRTLADLSTGARLLPGPLGATGTKRYFVAFQTDAEPRGLGGLPGNYAILQARHGRLKFLRFGTDSDLHLARAHVNLGADYRREFRHTYGVPYGPEKSFLNSDPSPNFPDAARIWMSMWQEEFHQHLDGAIATDPAALGYLLGATGPVTLADGTVIDSSSAVEFFESGIYARFRHDPVVRKRYQSRAAAAVASEVLHAPSGTLLASATAMQRAADEGRLLLYSSDASVESSLAHEPVGGVLPKTTNPFLGVIINNVAADKIGYYLDRTVTYARSTCAATTATVTVTVHNAAPASGLPPYVVGRHRGSTILIVSLYATDHSSVSRVTLDGTPTPFTRQRERGHPVTVASRFTIKPGQTQTLMYTVNEPAATGPMIALRQPGVRPLNQTITMPNCAG